MARNCLWNKGKSNVGRLAQKCFWGHASVQNMYTQAFQAANALKTKELPGCVQYLYKLEAFSGHSRESN